jgi:hypothetical protein
MSCKVGHRLDPIERRGERNGIVDIPASAFCRGGQSLRESGGWAVNLGIQGIQNTDLMPLFQKHSGRVRPDETGSPGYQNAHGFFIFSKRLA